MAKDFLEVPIPYFWIREEDDNPIDIWIKSTDKSMNELMNFLMKNPEELGTHFVVNTEGDIIQCVEPESKIKFFPGLPTPNIVGIIVAGETSEKQFAGLQSLCIHLCSEYSIPLNHIEINIANFPEFEFLNSLGAGIIDTLIHTTDE